LYSAYKSKDSLGASVAKEMCFQRSSEGIEGKSWPPQSGWKIVIYEMFKVTIK